ncbi:MAG: 3-isopropylmalate dehydratase small subunit [Bacillota bacterium]
MSVKQASTGAGAAGPILEGRTWRYGDNVDTDVIIPARYLSSIDPAELGRHCLEDLDPGFVAAVRPGDIIVAGRNFGCGSSREHAPLAIKAAGVGAVIAASFARIFFRNAVNIGLPIVESPEAAAAIQGGRRVSVDLTRGLIRDLDSAETWTVRPLPPFVLGIVQAGGLINLIKERHTDRA